MKKWLWLFLIVAVVITAILGAVDTYLTSSPEGGVGWITAKEYTGVALNDFLNFYQQGRFEKIVLSNGVKLAGYQAVAVAPQQKNFFHVPVDKQYLIYETNKPADTSLPEMGISLSGTQTPVEIMVEESSLLGTVFVEQILPLIFFIGVLLLAFRFFGPKGGGLPFGTKAGILRTNLDVKTKFKDVAGMEEVKQELIEVVDFLKDSKKYQAVGARIPKGVLLYGSPGSGKTLLARAVAGEAGVPFFSASGSEFMEMLVGMGAAKVRELFKKAKAASPSIIFIDEIDTIGKKRGSGMTGGHQEQEQTLNQILTEMDGFDTDTNVIVIAATNRPDTLDSALLRPGRFDRKVYVSRPTLEERIEILSLHAVGKQLADDVDLELLARRTSGFVGADLENIVNEAALKVAKENRKKLTNADFDYALEKIVMGPEKKIKSLKEKERNIVALHELGHAVTAYFLPNADPVEKISIVSRGMALGVTWMMPSEDRYLYSKSKFLDEMVTLLGGRAAEEVFFGKDEITTGASNDFEKVAKIAYNMILKYGMDEELGTVVYYDAEKTEFYPFKPYSEKLAEKVDQKVKDLVNDAYQKSLSLIKKNKNTIELMSAYLLEREYITKEEFNKLMEDPEHISETLIWFKKKTAQLEKNEKNEKSDKKVAVKKAPKRKKEEKKDDATLIQETLDAFLSAKKE